MLPQQILYVCPTSFLKYPVEVPLSLGQSKWRHWETSSIVEIRISLIVKQTETVIITMQILIRKIRKFCSNIVRFSMILNRILEWEEEICLFKLYLLKLDLRFPLNTSFHRCNLVNLGYAVNQLHSLVLWSSIYEVNSSGSSVTC